jgi:S-(hydroxymethyl)glutathione dehydrogenase / alcohol dehydrogenase
VKARAAIALPGDPGVIVGTLELMDPGPADVVVEVAASGICASDRHVMGTGMNFGSRIGLVAPPIVLGHELAGRVAEVGREVRGLRPGDRVVGASTPVCGRCDSCVEGFSNMCEMFGEVVLRTRYRGQGYEATAMCGLGSFADIAVLREEQLVRVETLLPDPELSLIGCGVITGAGAVFNRARITPGSSVAVIGCGGVGLAALQAARIAGAVRILAVDPSAAKRAAAVSLGASDAIDPGAGPVEDQILDATHGLGVNAAIEAFGSADTVRQALLVTGRGGICIQLGSPRPGERIEIPPGAGERLFVTSVYGSGNARRDIPRLAALAEAGRFDLNAMVSDTIGLEADAINAALLTPDPSVIRTVISTAGRPT